MSERGAQSVPHTASPQSAIILFRDGFLQKRVQDRMELKKVIASLLRDIFWVQGLEAMTKEDSEDA